MPKKALRALGATTLIFPTLGNVFSSHDLSEMDLWQDRVLSEAAPSQSGSSRIARKVRRTTPKVMTTLNFSASLEAELALAPEKGAD